LNEMEFSTNLKENKIAVHSIRPPFKAEWSIFQEVVDAQYTKAAKPAKPHPLSQFCDYVINGKDPKGVPLGVFGKIKTQMFRRQRISAQLGLSCSPIFQ